MFQKIFCSGTFNIKESEYVGQARVWPGKSLAFFTSLPFSTLYDKWSISHDRKQIMHSQKHLFLPQGLALFRIFSTCKENVVCLALCCNKFLAEELLHIISLLLYKQQIWYNNNRAWNIMKWKIITFIEILGAMNTIENYIINSFLRLISMYSPKVQNWCIKGYFCSEPEYNWYTSCNSHASPFEKISQNPNWEWTRLNIFHWLNKISPFCLRPKILTPNIMTLVVLCCKSDCLSFFMKLDCMIAAFLACNSKIKEYQN